MTAHGLGDNAGRNWLSNNPGFEHGERTSGDATHEWYNEIQQVIIGIGIGIGITTSVGVTADIGIQLASTFDGNNSPGHGRGASSTCGRGVPTISA